MSLSRTMPLADSKLIWPSRSSSSRAKRYPNSKERWAQRQMKIFGGGLQQISGRRAVRQGAIRRLRRRFGVAAALRAPPRRERSRRRGRKRSRQAARRRPRRGRFRGKPHPSLRQGRKRRGLLGSLRGGEKKIGVGKKIGGR